MKNNFAITYTVKNEMHLLPKAIAYHADLGCTRFFIYLDGTTDGVGEYFEKFKNIEILNSVKPNELINRPQWISDISDWWMQDMDVRKRINTFDAARKANELGIEWLVSIDPDELLIFQSNEKGPEVDSKTFFDGIPLKIDQILMPNLEAIPPTNGSSDPFVECTLFFRRFLITEFIWRYFSAIVRRVTQSSKIQAWFDFLFYQVRFLGILPRLMREPKTGAKIPAGYFLGYSNHKSIIRANKVEFFDFIIHKWRKYTLKPKTLVRGNVLHYDIFSPDYLIKKFGQRQKEMIMPIFYFRYRLALVAINFSKEDVIIFFNKYIAIGSEGRGDLLLRKGLVVKINSVKERLSNISL